MEPEILDYVPPVEQEVEITRAKTFRWIETALLGYWVVGMFSGLVLHFSIFIFFRPTGLLPWLYLIRGLLGSGDYRFKQLGNNFPYAFGLNTLGGALLIPAGLLKLQSWPGGDYCFLASATCVLLSLIWYTVLFSTKHPTGDERKVLLGISIRTAVFFVYLLLLAARVFLGAAFLSI